MRLRFHTYNRRRLCVFERHLASKNCRCASLLVWLHLVRVLTILLQHEHRSRDTRHPTSQICTIVPTTLHVIHVRGSIPLFLVAFQSHLTVTQCSSLDFSLFGRELSYFLSLWIYYTITINHFIRKELHEIALRTH